MTHPRRLLGAKYVMLGKEYDSIPPREHAGPVRELLITMGGADTDNLTARIIRAIDQIQDDFAIHIIVGPFNQHMQDVSATAFKSWRQVNITRAPNSLRQQICAADLAISAASQTLYELSAAGTPTVAVQLVANQAGNIASLAKAGSVLPIVSLNGETIVSDIMEATQALISDSHRRAIMSRAGQLLIDGRGTDRVEMEIVRLLSGKKHD